MLIKPTKTLSSSQIPTKQPSVCAAKTSVGGDSEKMTEKIKTEPGKSFLGRRRRRRLVATSVLPPLLDDQQDDTCSFPETRILQKSAKKWFAKKNRRRQVSKNVFQNSKSKFHQFVLALEEMVTILTIKASFV